MKKFLAIAFVSLMLVGCNKPTTENIVTNVRNGVVLIANQQDTAAGGIGTGFILEDNQIVTNKHVIDGNGKLTVYSPNSERKYEAVVVYSDSVSDIAVLRLKDWELFEKNETPSNLTLSDSAKTNPGDKVVVLGHPWGLSWTVSEGIISAKNRRVGQNPKYMDQVDAKLYQGNSGGPIFNESGEIVCVSNMMLSKEGGSYGFCIPSNLVKKVLSDLNEFNEVKWKALNVSVDMTEDGSYVIVKTLEPNGAAAKAGLKENDKILTINGKKIASPNDLITGLAEILGSVKTATMMIERDGKQFTQEVELNDRLSSDYQS